MHFALHYAAKGQGFFQYWPADVLWPWFYTRPDTNSCIIVTKEWTLSFRKLHNIPVLVNSSSNMLNGWNTSYGLTSQSHMQQQNKIPLHSCLARYNMATRKSHLSISAKIRAGLSNMEVSSMLPFRSSGRFLRACCMQVNNHCTIDSTAAASKPSSGFPRHVMPPCTEQENNHTYISTQSEMFSSDASSWYFWLLFT